MQVFRFWMCVYNLGWLCMRQSTSRSQPERRRWLLYQCDHTDGSWNSPCFGWVASSAEPQTVWPPPCCLCCPVRQTHGRTTPGRPAGRRRGAGGGQRSQRDALSLPFCSSCCCQEAVGWWSSSAPVESDHIPSAGPWASAPPLPALWLAGPNTLLTCLQGKTKQSALNLNINIFHTISYSWQKRYIAD